MKTAKDQTHLSACDAPDEAVVKGVSVYKDTSSVCYAALHFGIDIFPHQEAGASHFWGIRGWMLSGME